MKFFGKLLSFLFKKDEKKESNLAKIKTYNCLLNDSTTPSLTENLTLPPISNLKYTVKDFKNNPYSTNEKRAVNCHILVGNQINYIQRISLNLIKRWAGVETLNIVPLAGNDLNAYYDRTSLRFFYFRVPSKIIYTANSADIVTHELGHALLDAMRPDFWSVSALEIWSFHEAFSDITSMVSAMQYDKILNKVLLDTSNDISKSNIITRLAEEMGQSIYHYYDGKNTGYSPNYLRDCCDQKFKYVDPSTLPPFGLENQLHAECHSFGKVFAAAWYEIFARIYKLEIDNKNPPLVAIKKARDAAYSILVLSIPSSAKTVKYYKSIATSMCNLAKIKYPSYENIVNDVFVEWKILDNSLRILSNVKWSDVVYNLGKNDRVIKTSKETIVCMYNNKTIKLQGVSAMSDSTKNLLNVEIDVPADSYYRFDSDGNLLDEIVPNNEEILNSTINCAAAIQKSLGKEWAIENNKLVRKYIS